MSMTLEDWQDRYYEAECRHREFIAMSGEEHRQEIANMRRDADAAVRQWKAENAALRLELEQATADPATQAFLLRAAKADNAALREALERARDYVEANQGGMRCAETIDVIRAALGTEGHARWACCGAADPPCATFEVSCKNPANYPRCGICNDTGGVQRTEEGFPVGEPEPCPKCGPRCKVCHGSGKVYDTTRGPDGDEHTCPSCFGEGDDVQPGCTSEVKP
jgi:hypothetical protein